MPAKKKASASADKSKAAKSQKQDAKSGKVAKPVAEPKAMQKSQSTRSARGSSSVGKQKDRGSSTVTPKIKEPQIEERQVVEDHKMEHEEAEDEMQIDNEPMNLLAFAQFVEKQFGH